METMTIERIKELQEEYQLTKAQNWLNTGDIWKLEGYYGRTASEMLESGILILPEERTSDYYGNIVPARTDLKAGTKGTLELAQEFWTEIERGNPNAIEYVEQFRGLLEF